MRTIIPFNRPFLRTSIAIAVLTALPIALQAQQQQKVSGPQARYWVQAETRSGMAGMMAGGAGGMGAAMSSMFGRGGGERRKWGWVRFPSHLPVIWLGVVVKREK